MMPQAEALYRLQQIDLDILRQRQRLSEIDALLADNEAVKAAQETRDAAEDALKPLRTRARDLELALQTTNEKSQTSEKRLYSGNVKSPKELQDLQNEIAALGERKNDLEESLLMTMMEIEEAEDALKEAQDALAAVLAEAESDHGDLLSERAEIETRIAEQEDAREKAVTNVTPQNRKLYDTMKARKANRPISRMEGRLCTACGVEQTMTIASAVRKRDELVRCENCGRILVEP
jgi:hypothetical protein